MQNIKFYCVTNKKINFLNSKFSNQEMFNLCWVGKGAAPKNYLTFNKGDNF